MTQVYILLACQKNQD